MANSNIQQIISHIKAGNLDQARDLLRTGLKECPSADAWFLAAYVAPSQNQKIAFLQKALEMNPFHERAFQALEKLQNKPRDQLGRRWGWVVVACSIVGIFLSLSYFIFAAISEPFYLRKLTVSLLSTRKGVYYIWLLGFSLAVPASTPSIQHSPSIQKGAIGPTFSSTKKYCCHVNSSRCTCSDVRLDYLGAQWFM